MALTAAVAVVLAFPLILVFVFLPVVLYLLAAVSFVTTFSGACLAGLLSGVLGYRLLRTRRDDDGDGITYIADEP
jgi:hypothetical protein